LVGFIRIDCGWALFGKLVIAVGTRETVEEEEQVGTVVVEEFIHA
jgi:hypothetical protein